AAKECLTQSLSAMAQILQIVYGCYAESSSRKTCNSLVVTGSVHDKQQLRCPSEVVVFRNSA
ncbi:MAG: hypothetical protein OES26_27240, partial [Gammaproteobacteria bacterium]|nr:hypothetical protein [Gammaproteobacteria bacterium]